MILTPKSPNRSYWFWGPNQKTWATDFKAKLGETVATGFEAKPEKTVTTDFEVKPLTNCPSGFEAKTLINYWPWFWGSTKKLALLISSCTVQITQSITRPPDCPTTKYLTCAWLSPILRTKSPTPIMILVTARHAAPTTCAPWDKETQFSKWNKINIKPSKCFGFKFKPRQVNKLSQSN
jgi:hypothetical protein